MVLPPVFINVHVRSAEAANVHIPLPLFLLWPLLLVLAALALLVTLVTDLVLLLAGARYHHFSLLLLHSLRLLADVRGTSAHVITGRKFVDIDIH
jgi:hypothetical protein